MLDLFTKYYNKGFVSIEDEFSWVNNSSKKINVKVLVRLMTRTGGAFPDAQMEKDGDWVPQHVFYTVNFDNIVKVKK